MPFMYFSDKLFHIFVCQRKSDFRMEALAVEHSMVPDFYVCPLLKLFLLVVPQDNRPLVSRLHYLRNQRITTETNLPLSHENKL